MLGAVVAEALHEVDPDPDLLIRDQATAARTLAATPTEEETTIPDLWLSLVREALTIKDMETNVRTAAQSMVDAELWTNAPSALLVR